MEIIVQWTGWTTKGVEDDLTDWDLEKNVRLLKLLANSHSILPTIHWLRQPWWRETVAIKPINIPDWAGTVIIICLVCFQFPNHLSLSLSLSLFDKTVKSNINHFITLIFPQYDAMDGWFFSNHSIPFGSMTWKYIWEKEILLFNRKCLNIYISRCPPSVNTADYLSNWYPSSSLPACGPRSEGDRSRVEEDHRDIKTKSHRL